MSKREAGLYWVKVDGEWSVAEWVPVRVMDDLEYMAAWLVGDGEGFYEDEVDQVGTRAESVHD